MRRKGGQGAKARRDERRAYERGGSTGGLMPNIQTGLDEISGQADALPLPLYGYVPPPKPPGWTPMAGPAVPQPPPLPRYGYVPSPKPPPSTSSMSVALPPPTRPPPPARPPTQPRRRPEGQGSVQRHREREKAEKEKAIPQAPELEPESKRALPAPSVWDVITALGANPTGKNISRGRSEFPTGIVESDALDAGSTAPDLIFLHFPREFRPKSSKIKP